jgi:hypothetical protein
MARSDAISPIWISLFSSKMLNLMLSVSCEGINTKRPETTMWLGSAMKGNCLTTQSTKPTLILNSLPSPTIHTLTQNLLNSASSSSEWYDNDIMIFYNCTSSRQFITVHYILFLTTFTLEQSIWVPWPILVNKNRGVRRASGESWRSLRASLRTHGATTSTSTSTSTITITSRVVRRLRASGELVQPRNVHTATQTVLPKPTFRLSAVFAYTFKTWRNNHGNKLEQYQIRA